MQAFLFICTVHGISMMIAGVMALGYKDIDPLYSVLSIFVSFCFLWFMLQGVLRENTYQLCCCILSAFLVTIFLFWCRLNDIRNNLDHPLIKALAWGSTCFCGLYLIIAPFVVRRFGWYRYNKTLYTNQVIYFIAD